MIDAFFSIPAGRLMRRATLAILAACLGAAPAQAQELWGHELPDFGADTGITALYRSPAGAIVMGFAYGPWRARRADFYDTGLKKRLAPERAAETAADHAAQARVAASLHLAPIAERPEVTNAAGTQFKLEDLTGGTCLWPYSGVVTITAPAGPPQRWLVAWKLAQVENQPYGCSHATALQDVTLRTKFQEEDPRWYGGADADVYAVFAHRYLVRFDAKGQTHFFDHRKDAVMVRADGIAPLVAGIGAAHTAGQAQALVDRIETLIAAGWAK